MSLEPEKFSRITKPLDLKKDRALFEKAKKILSANVSSNDRLEVQKLERTKEGYYRAHFAELPRRAKDTSSASYDSALLDLEFPFAQEDMKTILDRHRDETDTELFLSFGPGGTDYPKKRDNDPKENSRVFIVVDQAFGHVKDPEKKRDMSLFHIEHYVTSRDIGSETPGRTYMYNRFPSSIACDAFDTIQAINVISEPAGFSDPRDQIENLTSFIKPGTGELFLLEDYTPDVYPLERVKKEVEQLGYTMEVLFNYPESRERTIRDDPRDFFSEEMMQKLTREYHVNSSHFHAGRGYAVVIRKPEKSESS